MRAMVEASRAEDGCLGYSYAEDVLEPGLIHVAERWRDRAALVAGGLQSDATAQVRNAVIVPEGADVSAVPAQTIIFSY